MAEKIRLQKFLSECGVSSRRKAEEYILAGDVTVNGETAHIGYKVDPDKDVVLVRGVRVTGKPSAVYLMLYKPRGFITTMSDEQGRKCVASLVSDVPERVYPVGRLDRDSEGLLLFTNDGEFDNYMMHPSGRISKTYRVTVSGRPDEDQMTALTSSVMIDGRGTVPAVVKVIDMKPDRTVLEMTLREGRNREIRKICENCSLTVLRLKRISEGPLSLGMLQPGKWRYLTPEEISAVKNAIRRISNAKN